MPSVFSVESLLDLREAPSPYSMNYRGLNLAFDPLNSENTAKSYLKSCIADAPFSFLKAHNDFASDSNHPANCSSKFSLEFNKRECKTRRARTAFTYEQFVALENKFQSTMTVISQCIEPALSSLISNRCPTFSSFFSSTSSAVSLSSLSLSAPLTSLQQ
ncbi:unnamed protein product [Acanthocheilonema viteae]|uniref:Homeobox domain-containing protein n=1 Tax=Acanthocheilonema viteae TaxID=6277 RepID=A0A498S6L2_ACAVI|nr:unnamed protein product [Acanthocheilonema viteae]